MNDNLRNKSKYTGIKRIVASTAYSIDGIKYSFLNEKSLMIYSVLSIMAIILAFLLDISINQWMALLLALGVVLTIELINTAIEATVDMVTTEYNPLAKIAKDCGSAATFVSSIIALIIALVIFVPKIILLF